MASFENAGKPAYMYDEDSDTWYLISGKTDTSAGYQWTGTHSFLNTVTASDVLNAKAGVNNFLNPAARDAAIPTPSAGTVCFVRQDATGTSINKLQAYVSGSWKWIDAQAINVIASTSYTLSSSDAGNIVESSSSSAVTITVPPNSTAAIPVGSKIQILQSGTGQVSFLAGSGVSLNSSGSKLKISGQWLQATLLKRGTDAWVLYGDITS